MDKLTEDLLRLEAFSEAGQQTVELEKKKRKKEIIAEANLFYQTFNTESGKLVLDKLMETFLTKSIAKPNDDMISIGIREGQARTVRWMLQQIEIAKKG